MSKQRKQRPYIFGRVFFPGEAVPVVNEVRLQPLGDHVGNVCRLVKQWYDLPHEDSRSRTLEAAKIHDMGKPQRFSIQVQTDSKGKFKKYIYSFRGHRFLAQSNDDWVQALARGHHDFSVGDITRDTYQLRKNIDYTAVLSQDPLIYAKELYILEMCDQIEAELACRILGDEPQAESRTFMDYTLSEGGEGVYLLDPWPFQKPQLHLKFHHWSKQLTENERTHLQELHDHNENQKLGPALDEIIKSWWHQQTQNPKSSATEVILKPAFTEQSARPSIEQIYQRLAGFSPNPMQDAVFHAIFDSAESALLVKAPTGTGKTESVLFPALAKGYRLLLPLPTRSLLEDQKERIERYLLRFSNLSENQNREISLVVDTGSQMYRWVYQNGKDITKELKINLRRHLYKGDVILTTIDKFLYRYFAFGDQQKSFVFPLRIHRSKTLICFDEAHSYDDISFTNFQSLVRSLYEAGRSLVLMTATMPQQLADSFDYLDKIDYIDDPECVEALQLYQKETLKYPYLKQHSFQWIENICRDTENPEAFALSFAQLIKDEWQANPDRRILAVVQTVKDAAAIYTQLKSQIGNETSQRKIFLYHGRLADQERPKVYSEIQQRDHNAQPYILITTSAIEVGCDLNAETLISEICPPENLIQRVGRCNRKGNVPDAKVIVLGNKIPDFASSLDELGWEKYQNTLRNLKTFDTEEVSKCISRLEYVDDYRVVEIFSMLHNYVYSADLTCQPSYDKGLIITRSWTPSATLVFDDGNQDDWVKNLSNLPKTSVPLDRLLLTKADDIIVNQYAHVHVYERVYDKETTQWKMSHLRWGSAYSKDIVVYIGAEQEGIVCGSDKPYKYDPELGFVNLPGIFSSSRKGSDLNIKLFYQLADQHPKTVMITYIQALGTQSE